MDKFYPDESIQVFSALVDQLADRVLGKNEAARSIRAEGSMLLLFTLKQMKVVYFSMRFVVKIGSFLKNDAFFYVLCCKRPSGIS
jgi:hypothetical protein